MGGEQKSESDFKPDAPRQVDADMTEADDFHSNAIAEEEDSLLRLSEQARRNNFSSQGNDGDYEVADSQDDESDDSHEDMDDHEEDQDDDDFDEFNGSEQRDFFSALLSGRGQRNEDDAEQSDNEDEEGDERMDFLRAIGSFSNANNSTGRERSFAEVIERLMNGGVLIGRGHNEFENLVNNLIQREDPYIILESLNELSERLLMMNAITAERVLPSNQLSKALTDIMEDPSLADRLELQLVACRCLYNFLEVNPDFIQEAIDNNAIEAVCKKLSELSFIDLTEQALQTLEMFSRDPISHNQIVANNGLKSCLQYLDFLTVHSQRKCLSIVANSCSHISTSNFEMIDEVFENISTVVKTHSDSAVIESGWLAISRIITSFKSYPALLEKLFSSRTDLLAELASTIVVSSNKSSVSNSADSTKVPVTFATCLSLIKSLIILVSVSADLSGKFLLEIHVGKSIVKAVNRFAKSKVASSSHKTDQSAVSIEAIMAAPTELLSQFLSLIGYLLPIAYSAQETPFLKNSHQDYDEKVGINDRRLELCRDQIPDSFWEFVNDIWLFLLNCFQASMDFEVRRKVLIDIFRVIKFMDQSSIQRLKGIELISGLLESIVNQNKSIIFKEFAPKEEDDKMVDDDSNEQDDTNKSTSDNTSKLNSNILLLSALLLTLNMMRLDQKTFVESVEKEGLMKDILSIHESLKRGGVNDEQTKFDAYEGSRPFSSSYNSKYFDVELTKDYEYKLTSARIYNKLYHISSDIEELYEETKRLLGAKGSSNSLQLLEQIKSNLSSNDLSSLDFESWQQLWVSLREALNTVSSFELISSGVIPVLTSIFGCEEFGTQSSVCYNSFVSVFFRQESTIPVQILVEKLQEALTRTESFEIISASNQDNTRVTNSLYYDAANTAGMARQIKLKLVSKDPTSFKLPTSMQNMILSIHAIATFASINTFLKQRLNFFEALAGKNNSDSDTDIDQDQNHEIEEVEDEDEDESHSEDEATEEINDDSSQKERTPRMEDHDHDHTRIDFFINGERIPNETTIYGAIYRSFQSEPDEIVDSTKVWSTIHEISFQKVDANVDPEEPHHLYNSTINYEELKSYNQTSISILSLVKILFEMNEYAGSLNLGTIEDDKFMNWKLSVKLNRQLEEPLVVASGTLPGWAIHITRQFPFLFPLETRIFFLQSTSFGYSRLIHQWQIRTNQENESNNRNNGATQRPQLGRQMRHKVRISRKLILQSAIKVLNLYGTTPGVLEIEYFDEVGSGLGPTLEFYSLVSKEFSKRKLKLWRDEDTAGDQNDLVTAKTGLFPAPLDKVQLQTEDGKKTLFFFSILGKFIARALLDSRIIDFRFNTLFLKIIQIFNDNSLNERGFQDLKKITNLNSLRLVDPALAKSMEHLMKYVEAFRHTKQSEHHLVTVDDCTLEDLALTFSLPGYPEYQLVPNGNEIYVDASNIEVYINKVLEATLYSGIISQIKAFMDGFSKVFPISSLIVFSPEELSDLFGNAEEDWSYETLYSSINANHGYTKDSQAIRLLIHTLTEFDDIQRRTFLQFLTGAPKLPIGGFKSLKPELTVVRKYPETNTKDDEYLPSVMTCANYLKLPNYSSVEIMKLRLLQAINEGAGAFLLS